MTLSIFLIALLARLALSQNLKVFEAPVIRLAGAPPFTSIVNLGVGSPPQKMSFILDSGSSDLWVPQSNSTLCKDKNQQCSGTPLVTGSFNSASSSSLVALPKSVPFFTNYVNGVSVNGTFITETIAFGNKSVEKSQLGLATTGVLPFPLFPIAGLGYTNFEGIIQTGQKSYTNTVAGMKASGQIKSASFAMYLNDFRASQGSILIGGVDAAKFSGKLETVPLTPDQDGQFRTFFVPWTSFTFQQGGAANNTNATAKSEINLAPSQGLPDALIDSGDSEINIPLVLVQAMGKALGVKVVDQSLAPLPCTAGNSGSKFTVGFANKAKIDIPMSMLMVPLTDNNGKAVANKQGQALCELPVSALDGSATLGAPFMQAAYIVFDMDKNQLLMAQAKMNVTETQIQEYISA